MRLETYTSHFNHKSPKYNLLIYFFGYSDPVSYYLALLVVHGFIFGLSGTGFIIYGFNSEICLKWLSTGAVLILLCTPILPVLINRHENFKTDKNWKKLLKNCMNFSIAAQILLFLLSMGIMALTFGLRFLGNSLKLYRLESTVLTIFFGFIVLTGLNGWNLVELVRARKQVGNDKIEVQSYFMDLGLMKFVN